MYNAGKFDHLIWFFFQLKCDISCKHAFAKKKKTIHIEKHLQESGNRNLARKKTALLNLVGFRAEKQFFLSIFDEKKIRFFLSDGEVHAT